MKYCTNIALMLLVLFPLMLGVAAQPYDKEKFPLLYRWTPMTGWILTALLAVIFHKSL